MSRTIRTRTRRIMASAAMAAMMFALMPAAPASADDLTIAVQGTATLNNGTLACGTGTFSGTAAGTHGTVPVVNRPVTAQFEYCDDLVEGTAEGEITVAGHGVCVFVKVRVGHIATIVFRGRVGGPPCHGSATVIIIVTSAPGAIPGTAEWTGEGTIGH